MVVDKPTCGVLPPPTGLECEALQGRKNVKLYFVFLRWRFSFCNVLSQYKIRKIWKIKMGYSHHTIHVWCFPILDKDVFTMSCSESSNNSLFCYCKLFHARKTLKTICRQSCEVRNNTTLKTLQLKSETPGWYFRFPVRPADLESAVKRIPPVACL